MCASELGTMKQCVDDGICHLIKGCCHNWFYTHACIKLYSRSTSGKLSSPWKTVNPAEPLYE